MLYNTSNLGYTLLCFFSLSTNGSAICISFGLTSFPTMYIHQLKEVSPPAAENTVGICKKINFSFFS
jgi:hypothetical protein